MASRPSKPERTGGAIAPNFDQVPYWADFKVPKSCRGCLGTGKQSAFKMAVTKNSPLIPTNSEIECKYCKGTGLESNRE
ncbi:hypothetical protein LG275_03845 [Chryseomicrobium palamuruense]